MPLSFELKITHYNVSYIRGIGEQGGGWGVATTCSTKFLWPPNTQNDPHPLRNGFWPLFFYRTWIFSFLSWRHFFLEKKI